VASGQLSAETLMTDHWPLLFSGVDGKDGANQATSRNKIQLGSGISNLPSPPDWNLRHSKSNLD
jgi:hypothetical protein